MDPGGWASLGSVSGAWPLGQELRKGEVFSPRDATSFIYQRPSSSPGQDSWWDSRCQEQFRGLRAVELAQRTCVF